jgi:hypothetical protein
VVDERGFGVKDAAVYSFSVQHEALIEETLTDEDGDFTLSVTPEEARVYVVPPREGGLLSAWGPLAEDSSGRLAFVLHPSREVRVTVRDAGGKPVAGAEVRAYDLRGELAVVSLVETDADGRARLRVPARAHVAALAPDPPRSMSWRFDLEVAAEGAAIELLLPAARPLRGSVRDEGGPLANICLLSGREGADEGPTGMATSATDGSFELACDSGPFLLQAVDPDGTHLPYRARLSGDSCGELVIQLERGRPLVVRTTRGGFPIESRVWSWSPSTQAWGWGTRTRAGRATVAVDESYSLHALPLDPAFDALEVWNVPYEQGSLHLEAKATP